MTDTNQERLYHYLPLVYQRRDKDHKQVLRTLLAVMEKELQGFRQELDTSYRNIFIETCEQWAIPYIGDLLGIKNLHDQGQDFVNQRPRVANTLRYRKRKGQQSVLERVISDVTGWRAKVVAFSKSLATTQHMQHIRPLGSTVANVRNLNVMETLNTAFDKNTHTADIRDAQRYQAKYNFDIVGLFIWRLNSYQITTGTAHKKGTGQYTFHPLGLDMPLYQKPQINHNLAKTAQETNFPAVLRPRALANDLSHYQKLYQGLTASARPQNSNYYGPERSFNLTLVTGEKKTVVLHEQFVVMDLSGWRLSPAANKIAIDTKLGRFKLGTGIATPDRIEVKYHYAFSADIGGGHYARYNSLATVDSTATLVRVAKSNTANSNGRYNSINSALIANAAILTATSGKKHLIIQVEDDATYSETIADIILSNKSSLTIQSANSMRPCIKLTRALNFAADASNNQVTINGLLIQGTVGVKGNIAFNLNHTTLVPQLNVASISLMSGDVAGTKSLNVNIRNSIIGVIQLPSSIANMNIQDSSVDAKGNNNVAIQGKQPAQGSQQLPGPSLCLQRCTVIGQINVVETSLISESIITGTVKVNRIQTGCVRYSSLPLFAQNSKNIISRTPERYRCQPELSFIPLAEQRAVKLGLTDYKAVQAKDTTWWNLTLTSLRAQFNSTDYGSPDYLQLRRKTHVGLRKGAEDGSEMGVFKNLKQAQRENNLNNIIDEFLGFDLNMEIFYVN